MKTKVERIHLRNIFHVESGYDFVNYEITLTFIGGVSDSNYLSQRVIVLHIRTYLLAFIVGVIKDAARKMKQELDEFEKSVSSGLD